jgi:hypothetical protein
VEKSARVVTLNSCRENSKYYHLSKILTLEVCTCLNENKDAPEERERNRDPDSILPLKGEDPTCVTIGRGLVSMSATISLVRQKHCLRYLAGTTLVSFMEQRNRQTFDSLGIRILTSPPIPPIDDRPPGIHSSLTGLPYIGRASSNHWSPGQLTRLSMSALR